VRARSFTAFWSIAAMASRNFSAPWSDAKSNRDGFTSHRSLRALRYLNRMGDMIISPAACLAVLIDGENIASSHADELFKKIENLGTASVRRLYGDWQNGRMKDWAAAAERHAMLAVHVQSNGKNSTDIAMAIDAMDMLHSGRFDGFCLVTSDRDFTRLATRIREQGCDAYGFGGKTAPNALVRAFRKFVVLGDAAPATKPPANPAPKPAPPPVAAKHPTLARPWIDAALTAAGSEWMSLSALGQAIRAKESAYLKKTGYSSLKQLLSAMNDKYEQSAGTDGKTAQVRSRKPAAKSVEKLATNTTAIKRPHLAWPWIEAALPADLNEWVTLSALEQVLNTSHPDYLEKSGFASLKAVLRGLADHFELGLAEDGKTAQVRRRTA
jgi:uncharacterized LabA/DUF88 family protein